MSDCRKNTLIISAGSKDDLRKAIAEYWMCETWTISLADLGHVRKKRQVMPGFFWRKKGSRYRFEAEGNFV